MEPITRHSCRRGRCEVYWSGCRLVLSHRITGEAVKQASEDLCHQGYTFFHANKRLEDRMDRRFAKVLSEVNQQISDVRSGMNQQIEDIRKEITSVKNESSKLNQNHIEHLTHQNRN